MEDKKNQKQIKKSHKVWAYIGNAIFQLVILLNSTLYCVLEKNNIPLKKINRFISVYFFINFYA